MLLALDGSLSFQDHKFWHKILYSISLSGSICIGWVGSGKGIKSMPWFYSGKISNS